MLKLFKAVIQVEENGQQTVTEGAIIAESVRRAEKGFQENAAIVIREPMDVTDAYVGARMQQELQAALEETKISTEVKMLTLAVMKQYCDQAHQYYRPEKRR